MSKVVRKKKNLITAIVIVTGIFLVTGYFIMNIVLASVFAKPLDVVYALKKAGINSEAISSVADEYFAKMNKLMPEFESEDGVFTFINDKSKVESTRAFLDKTASKITSKQFAEFVYNLGSHGKSANFFERIGLLYSSQTMELVKVGIKHKPDNDMGGLEQYLDYLRSVDIEYGSSIAFFENAYKICSNLQTIPYDDIAIMAETINDCFKLKDFEQIMKTVPYNDLLLTARNIAHLLHNVQEVEISLNLVNEFVNNDTIKTLSEIPSLITLAVEVVNNVDDDCIYNVLGNLFDYNSTLVAGAKVVLPFANKYSNQTLAKEVDSLLTKFCPDSNLNGNGVIDFLQEISGYDTDNLTDEQNQKITQFFDNFLQFAV